MIGSLGGAATPSARSTDEAPCPFCGGPTTCCLVFCDGHVFETYRRNNRLAEGESGLIDGLCSTVEAEKTWIQK